MTARPARSIPENRLTLGCNSGSREAAALGVRLNDRWSLVATLEHFGTVGCSDRDRQAARPGQYRRQARLQLLTRVRDRVLASGAPSVAPAPRYNRGMVKLNRIYTRTGDDGTTGAGHRPAPPKYDLRVQAYGTVDETNACIGIARLHAPARMPRSTPCSGASSNDLFDLGADLSTPDTGEPPAYEPLRIVQAQVERHRGRDRHAQCRARRRCAPSCCPAERRRRRICIWPAPSAGGRSG